MQLCCFLVVRSQPVGCLKWPTWKNNATTACVLNDCGYFFFLCIGWICSDSDLANISSSLHSIFHSTARIYCSHPAIQNLNINLQACTNTHKLLQSCFVFLHASPNSVKTNHHHRCRKISPVGKQGENMCACYKDTACLHICVQHPVKFRICKSSL